MPTSRSREIPAPPTPIEELSLLQLRTKIAHFAGHLPLINDEECALTKKDYDKERAESATLEKRLTELGFSLYDDKYMNARADELEAKLPESLAS